MKQSVKGPVLALALAVGATGAISVTAGIVNAPPAAAFGLSDIKKAAKSVGSKAAYVGKHGSKIVGGLAKDAVKGAKKANDIVTYVPKAVARGARDTALDAAGKAYSKYQKTLLESYWRVRGEYDEAKREKNERDARKVYEVISGAGRRVDGVVSGAKRKARKVLTEGITSGESLPRVGSVQQASKRRTQAENALQRYMNKGTTRKNAARARFISSRPIGTAKPGLAKGGAFYKRSQGITRKDVSSGRPVGTVKTGVVLDKSFRGVKGKPIGRDKSVWGRPVGGVKKPIGRDKSVWGRPVGGVKGKPIGRDKSVWGRPVGGVKKPIGRDKSVWGRPVGGVKRAKTRPPVTGISRENLRRKGQKQSLRLIHKKRLGNPRRKVQGITRENLKPSRKAKGFATKDKKLRRDNSRRKQRFDRRSDRKLENRRSRRGAASAGNNRRKLRMERSSKRHVERRGKRRSQGNRRGRRG